MNVISHSSLMERELEAKVEARVSALIASGRNPAEISPAEIEDLCRQAWEDLSPNAKRKAGEEGILLIVTQVMGERLADRLWTTGEGWSVDADSLRALAVDIGMDPSEAKDCLAAFREKAESETASNLSDWRSLGRFAPLFLAQPADISLGAAASKRAAQGDKLATAFLEWRDVE